MYFYGSPQVVHATKKRGTCSNNLPKQTRYEYPLIYFARDRGSFSGWIQAAWRKLLHHAPTFMLDLGQAFNYCLCITGLTISVYFFKNHLIPENFPHKILLDEQICSAFTPYLMVLDKITYLMTIIMLLLKKKWATVVSPVWPCETVQTGVSAGRGLGCKIKRGSCNGSSL